MPWQWSHQLFNPIHWAAVAQKKDGHLSGFYHGVVEFKNSFNPPTMVAPGIL
jgi:hypothetical protein